MYHQGGFFDGFLEAAGGIGDVENGAAGTVYVEKAGNSSDHPHRTLKVDNKGRSPLTERINQVHVIFNYYFKSVITFLDVDKMRTCQVFQPRCRRVVAMIYSHVRVDFQESNFGFGSLIMMIGLEYKGV